MLRPRQFMLSVVCYAALIGMHSWPAWSDPFTYQGRLLQNGSTHTGPCDFKFSLLDAPFGGNQIGPTLTFDGIGTNPPPVNVTNGLFTVPLDFGPAAFNGTPRFLEIRVRCPSGGGGYVLMSPNQAITAAPEALHAQKASGINGALNMGNQPITGIGTSGSSFTPTGGLNLMANLDMGGNTIVNIGSGASSFSATGGLNLSSDLVVGTGIVPAFQVRNSPLEAIAGGDLIVLFDLRVTGRCFDSTGSPGNAGQVLSSTNLGTQWISIPGINGGDGEFDNLLIAGTATFGNAQNPKAQIDAATGNAEFDGFIQPKGGIKDANLSLGTANQVLASTGAGVMWIDCDCGGASGGDASFNNLSVAGNTMLGDAADDTTTINGSLTCNNSASIGESLAVSTSCTVGPTPTPYASFNSSTCGFSVPISLSTNDTTRNGLSINYSPSSGTKACIEVFNQGTGTFNNGVRAVTFGTNAAALSGDGSGGGPGGKFSTTGVSNAAVVANGTTAIQANGNVNVTGTVTASCGTLICSDERFKTNTSPIEDALTLVEKLRPVRFDWKRSEFPHLKFSEQRQVGLIAQELRAVAPELVEAGRDGYLAVDYARLTPILVAAMQEQQSVIRDQQSAVERQEQRIAALEARLAKLADSSTD